MHAGLFPYIYVSFQICGSFSAYLGLCWLMGLVRSVFYGLFSMSLFTRMRLFAQNLSIYRSLSYITPVCVSLLGIFPYIGLFLMSLSIRTRLFSKYVFRVSLHMYTYLKKTHIQSPQGPHSRKSWGVHVFRANWNLCTTPCAPSGQSCHMYRCVVSHIDASWHTYERVMSRMNKLFMQTEILCCTVAHSCKLKSRATYPSSCAYVWLVPFFSGDMTHSCVSWRIHGFDMTQSCLTWRIYMFDMTHAWVWHDIFIRVTPPIYTCDLTYSYVWRDSFICVTWLIHICDMTFS